MLLPESAVEGLPPTSLGGKSDLDVSVYLRGCSFLVQRFQRANFEPERRTLGNFVRLGARACSKRGSGRATEADSKIDEPEDF